MGRETGATLAGSPSISNRSRILQKKDRRSRTVGRQCLCCGGFGSRGGGLGGLRRGKNWSIPESRPDGPPAGLIRSGQIFAFHKCHFVRVRPFNWLPRRAPGVTRPTKKAQRNPVPPGGAIQLCLRLAGPVPSCSRKPSATRLQIFHADYRSLGKGLKKIFWAAQFFGDSFSGHALGERLENSSSLVMPSRETPMVRQWLPACCSAQHENPFTFQRERTP